MSVRRELRFKTLDDARRELSILEKGPVVTMGNWSYFQILNHCAGALEGTMKGLKREFSWWKRNVTGPLAARKVMAQGFIPAGVKSSSPQTERVEGDEKIALGRLKKAMDEFETFDGPFSEHPRFGPLNKKQWIHFHAMHMANHLGFVSLKDQENR
jgi:hypothetical protein